ncbi:MAG: hypothetical protein U5J62_07630 [Desulfurivibrio sp.]|nr:hypothetical protein [Desulfurivibrio sp.]
MLFHDKIRKKVAAGREPPRLPRARGLLRRLLRRLMFVDLPIKRKFILFAAGTAF